MNPARFRTLVLEVEGASESSHAGHPDFRIGNKIFATLPFDEDFGVLNLTPDAQDEFVERFPKQFEPLNGAWGAHGWTKVHFAAARVGPLRNAIEAAQAKVAPASTKATGTATRKIAPRASASSTPRAIAKPKPAAKARPSR